MSHDEAHYRLIAESSRDMISRTDARAVCTYVSPACREVLGYEPDELVGRSLFDLVHPDERERNRAIFDRVIATGKVVIDGPYVARLQRKDGRFAWIESTSMLLHDASGAIVAVQSSGRDVSERVAAQEALARSEKNFRETIDRLPYGVVVHREGRFVYANPSFARLLGHDDAGWFIGREVLEHVAPDSRDRVRARVQATNREFAMTPEHNLLGRDGRSVVVQVTGMPVMFEGQLADMAVVEDLSARKALEAELAAADRLAALGRLAAAVGHEINNPLAYVVANLELLHDDVAALGQGAKPLADRLAVVQEGLERVRAIVGDLKHFSSIREGELGSVDPASAIERAIATASHELRLRARVVRRLDATRHVRADERRLVQVLVNLLVNAAQAIPQGSADGNEVGVATRDEPDGAVSIEVWDTGVGLPGGDPAKLFEPFFTTKREHGTGLGLSISHRIVTAFGGAIHAERRTPRGSIFRVTLPSAEAEVAEPAAAPAQTSNGRRLRVLLVDDEDLLARSLAALLSDHEVVIEQSARGAIERLTNDDRFDAILCDLQMRDGSGARVYAHARKARPGLEQRFVFMTGGVFTDESNAFARDCAQPVLAKPFPSGLLLSTLASVAPR